MIRAIRAADEMASLAPEWNDLARRCPGYFLSQTFQWADTAWRTVAGPRGRDLFCVALRDGQRLVAVWPLVVRRERGLRIVSPLGFEGSEYCAPLVEPGAEAERRVALLWRAAKDSADLAILSEVRADSPIAAALAREGSRAVTYGAVGAPYLARADYADWDAYAATVSARLRYEVRRGHRRLTARGEVTLRRATPADAAALIDWTLQQKKRWLADARLGNDWIGRRDFRDFLAALAARGDETGELALFALRVDGVPVASHIVSVDRTRIEGYVGAYDPDWSNCSPGNVLTEHVLRWAFERGLDVDFRVGDEPYKEKWTDRSVDTATWQVATSATGLPTIVRWRAMHYLRRVRAKLRDR